MGGLGGSNDSEATSTSTGEGEGNAEAGSSADSESGLWSEDELDGSAESMAEAILGYGEASFDDDATVTSTGQGNSDALGGVGGNADGGAGRAGDHLGRWGSSNGDDGYVSGDSYASVAANSENTAFNQNIVQGVNFFGNEIDMTGVGGSVTSTWVGEDDA